MDLHIKQIALEGNLLSVTATTFSMANKFDFPPKSM
jgi:hypothetical protein